MGSKKEEAAGKKETKKQAEQTKKRVHVLFMVVGAVFFVALLVLFVWKISGASDNPSSKMVFKVGKEKVYLDEVNLCIFQNVTNLGIDSESLATTAEDGSSADEYYKNEILQVIMDYKVAAAVAKKQGITLSKEEKEAIKQDVNDYISKTDGHTLRVLGITQNRIEEIYTQRYLAHALEQTVTKDITVDKRNYCTMYMLLFPKLETDENGDYVTEDDGETPIMLSEEEVAKRKQEADAAYQELKDGADIEEIAVKYGVNAVSGQESNLSDGFGEPFSEYATSLKDGEISPVLETKSCYAILKMISANNEEMANQILDYYKSDLETETINENKVKWYKEAGVSETPEFVGNTWKNISLYDFVQYVEE